jgi:uncharacterized membrane protein YccC
MKASDVKRVKRLAQLTEYIHEQRAREAAESRQAQNAIAEALQEVHGHFGTGGMVESVFPDLLAKRAARLDRQLVEANLDLEKRIEVAAEMRAKVNGLEGKLKRMVSQSELLRTSKELEEAIDTFLRNSKASLR